VTRMEDARLMDRCLKARQGEGTLA
jgi:hypothetical protein